LVQFIGILLVFGGYTLVYAAVASGGKFATEPWAGLYADAYGLDNQDWAQLAHQALGGRFTPLTPTFPTSP